MKCIELAFRYTLFAAIGLGLYAAYLQPKNLLTAETCYEIHSIEADGLHTVEEQKEQLERCLIKAANNLK